MSPDLPVGWAWARVEDLAEIKSGSTPSNAEAQSEASGEIPWFKVSSMNLQGNETRMRHSQWWFNRNHAEKLRLSIIKSGSLIFPKLGGALLTNKRRVLDIDAVIDMNLMAVTAYGSFQDYLNRFFDTLNMANFSDGSVVPQLKKSVLRTIPIPLAPLPEQRRIVARIDELFAEIAEGEAALQRARQSLDTWRRALLKAAVTGELTRDWRENKRNNDDRADNQTGAGDDLAELRMPFAIPSGWVWRPIGEVGEVRLGRQRAPKYHSGPDMRHYLRVANVLEDKLDLSDVKMMNFTSDEVTRYKLVPGDILLNEGQSLDLVGRSAIYHGEIKDCCFQNTLIRFRSGSTVIPGYAQMVFLHYLHSKRFRRVATITTNMAHLSLGRLATIEFPLPPKDEQQVILDQYNIMQDTISELRSATPFEDANALRQSILKAAFEGHLVPQDPTDEPASALLARLHHGNPRMVTRRRRARANESSSDPSLPGLTRQSLDPRVEPASGD